MVELLSRPDCETYLTVRRVNQPRIPTPDFRENSELHGSVLAGLAPGAFSFGIPGLSVSFLGALDNKTYFTSQASSDKIYYIEIVET